MPPEQVNASNVFSAEEAMAEYQPSWNFFQLKKKPEEAEIDIKQLPPHALKLFNGQNGSMRKEWLNMQGQVQEEGGPAVIVHRGAEARRLRK